ncbi:transposase [Petroclostridium sp. X23]|uniref:transposase n=1 Tax=Petroclostridium sp. X23 TaxID=3045146 RepID=UPI0024ADC4B2|nr:transposase [Petroclostridium sp. X23]WHH58554.1 transposase [Petroclostridium sp. X23]
MSRSPRVLSQTGLYHIIFRGLNRQNIFEEDADFHKMLEILFGIKKERCVEVYAYCLMYNHVHLFIRENCTGDIVKVMHKLLTKYVGWYNFKYQRSGSLIGNRYKSEPIEDERYFFALTRYIHQNPIRAGIVKEISKYAWSSYNDYMSLDSGEKITDTYLILEMLSADAEEARREFIELQKEIGSENFHITDSKKLTDEQLRRKVIKCLDGLDPKEIGNKPRKERDEILRYLREKEKFTIGQLERLTGISRGIITRYNVQK